MLASLCHHSSRFAPRNIVWWAALVLAPVGLLALLDRWFVSVAELDSVWQVRSARIASSTASSPDTLPRDDSPSEWRAIKLPNAMLGAETLPKSVWYRMDVAVDRPQDNLWAIYLVGASANYRLFVNGRFVGESDPIVEPMPEHVAAMIFRFPGTLLDSAKNVVEIRSVSARPQSALRSVQVGPDAALSRGYRAAVFGIDTLNQIIVGSMLTVGLIMLVLSRSRSREAIFGWYAVALFFMAAHIGIRLMPYVPFGNAALWRNLIDIALGGYVICGLFFINRFVDATRPRFEKWLLYWGLLGAAVLLTDALVLHSKMPWFFYRVWLPPLWPVCLYQTWLHVRDANRQANIENRLLALITCVGLAAGSVDGTIGLASLASTVFLPYTMGPGLCAYWFVLLRRFVQAINSAESARVELETRVREKTAELERSLVRVKDMEREQALSAERERIMRDMHDGVGGQLVQALSIASSRPELRLMEEPLRGCLEELRLIIDSIEPVNGDLASVLGMLRMRMSRRLGQAGIQLRWRVDDIPILSDFGPSRVLHVSRIVHEAIANVLKHSDAKSIALSARVFTAGSQASIVIEIADDGSGFALAAQRGRGLDNMRRRAVELGAQLSLHSNAQGTTVRLELPLNTAASRNHDATQVPDLASMMSARGA